MAPGDSWAGSRAPAEDPKIDGSWQTLPRSDPPYLASLAEMCFHQGRLYVAAGLMVPDTTPEGDGPWSVAVWQDTAWAPLDFGPQGIGIALASDSDRLVLAMHEGSIHHESHAQAVHLFENGRWKRLGDEVVGTIEDLVFWRGMPVIGGHFKLSEQSKSVNLAVWRDGRWQALGGGVGGVAVPRVMALADDGGDLWVAGRFETAGRQQVTNVGVWDGQVWQTLLGGVNDKVSAMTVLPEGVAVAGVFTRAGGVTVPGLALFSGGEWQALPEIPKDSKPSNAKKQMYSIKKYIPHINTE